MRILVAEDDSELAEQIKLSLVREGHAVDLTYDGEEAGFLGDTEPYDLIILDLGLPKVDGISVLKTWRASNINVPVLILTARSSWTDKVDGLNAGADDYLAKPFHIPELIARSSALMRRNATQRNPVFETNGVSFDSRSGKVSVDHFPISLTSLETSILSYLFHNANRPITALELSEHIYEYGDDRDTSTVPGFISRLRKKLGKELIQTEHGRGYSIQLNT